MPARTSVKNLDIIISCDTSGALENLLLHAPDGRFQMATALDQNQDNDVALIDTRGAIETLVENAALTADLCPSPVLPEIMAAQELVCGTGASQAASMKRRRSEAFRYFRPLRLTK